MEQQQYEGITQAILEANRHERARRTRVILPIVAVMAVLLFLAYAFQGASRFASPYDTVTPAHYIDWAAGLLFVVSVLNIGLLVWFITRYL